MFPTTFRKYTSAFASAIRSSDAVLWTIIATWVLFYLGNIDGRRYTGWDTHDIGFENFLYFSDALRSLSLPLWNPLIQSGTFHPTFFNAGNYSPFQWLFILLSYVINPVYAYELMIQAAVLIGAIGFYLFLRSEGNNKYVSLFGANAFFLSALMPITGQIVIIFSLASLPWLLLFCREILRGEPRISWLALVFWASMTASFMSSGYPWLNVVNSAVALAYACNLIWLSRTGASRIADLPPRLARLAVFLAGVGILLLCYYLPGYLSMRFNYQQLAGDFVSPDIGLRGLVAKEHFPYAGFVETLVGAIDPRILKHRIDIAQLPLWSWGTGLVVWLALFHRRFGKGFAGKNLFWIGLIIFWAAYSAGVIGAIGNAIPVFNANRWWFLGQFYVSIGLVFLAATNLQNGFDPGRAHGFSQSHLALSSAAVLTLLIWFSAPVLIFVFTACAITFFCYFAGSDTEGRRQEAVMLLICLNTAAFISMPITVSVPRSQEKIAVHEPNNYTTLVEHREKLVNITDNQRHVDTTTRYIAKDESWLLDKTPFNHGYNPLGNPLYWYLKGEDFTRHLVSMTQQVRRERPLQRLDFASDNAFIDALVDDVRSDPALPTVDQFENNLVKASEDFRWSLRELRQEPNNTTIKVTANHAGYLLFSNVFFPGWEVLVNGRKANIVKVNRIFMGVYLEEAGDHEVIFSFHPLGTIALLLFSPLVTLGTLIFFSRNKSLSPTRGLFFFLPRANHISSARQ